MTATELHRILFDILITIDEICSAEHIPYSLGGGTMLGAVRHKGFIPWDDDADICIWNTDLPAFQEAMKKYLPDHYKFISPRDNLPYFYDFVYKVVDTRYTMHDPTEEDMQLNCNSAYIGVDVFLVSNSANSRYGARFHAFKYKINYGLARGHRVTKQTEKHSFVENIYGGVLSFCGKRMQMETIIDLQEKLCHAYDKRPGKYCIVSNDLPKYLSLPYEREWFDGNIQKEFEGRLMPVQKGYHEKLTLQYGDYMKPPANFDEFIKHVDLENET